MHTTPLADALFILLTAAAATACGGEAVGPEPQPTPGVTVEAGTGESAFQPLTNTPELALNTAAQGGGGSGSHFWVAVRVEGMDPHGVRIHETIRRADDRFTVSDITRHDDLQPDGDADVLTGFRAVIGQCNDVAGHELELTIEVEDANGQRGSDTRKFRAPAFCPRGCGGFCNG